jgi:putative MFS transporter
LPAAVRGKYGAILFLISNVTLPIAFGLGMLVLPLDPEAWRWIFFGCGIPALFVWYIRRSMPESPRWYETVGRYEEAEKVVSEIESYVEKITGQKLPPISADVQPLKLGERHSYLELFSKNMIVRTMWVSVFIMIQLAINFSIVTWLPTAFVQKGIDIQSSLMFSTIIMLGYPIGSYIGALLADRFSRRNVVIVVCTVGAICSYLYGISSSMTLLTILGFLVMTVLSAMFATTWASFIPEQFPTALRVRGFTFGLACGRLSSAISPFWVVFLMDRGGFSSVLLTNSVLFMLLIIIVIFFGVESRGRSLEEVNEIQLYH